MDQKPPSAVTLFIPCLMDSLYPQAAQDLVVLLRKCGFWVVYPQEQTCCGQPAFNQGYFDLARKLARRFLDIFESAECIVCPSGSCTAMVRKHYPELLAVEPVWLEKARTVGGRLYEASQFLSLFVPASRIRASFSGKVTYHDSCHSSRSLGIYQEPRALLAQVKGLELLEMADSKACCGFGGLFSLRFPEVSQAIAGEKVKQILATGAEWVVGNDPGCLMNIQGGLNRVKSPVKVKHLVEILNSRS